MLDMVLEYFGGFWGKMELLATVLLIINVYLLTQQKLINYWFGFAGVIVMGAVLQEFRLLSDMWLQWAFYAPLQVYGWYVWKYGKTITAIERTGPPDTMKVVKLGINSRIVVVSTIMIMAGGIGYYFGTYTDASYPYWDALTTSMSIVASVLLLWKVWDNWLIWITMDLIAIPLYYTKELYVVSGLYVIFLGLAIYGLITWSKDYDKHITKEYRDV